MIMPCERKVTPKVVGESVTRNAEFLRRLTRCRSPVKRLELLHKASKDQLLAMAEIALNILRARFPISRRQREELLPHANHVRKLSRARTESGARKTVQIGGGLYIPSLLRPVLAVKGGSRKNGSKVSANPSREL